MRDGAEGLGVTTAGVATATALSATSVLMSATEAMGVALVKMLSVCAIAVSSAFAMKHNDSNRKVIYNLKR